MKTEDFERLKAVCEKEGFEIIIANRSLKDVFEIHKKDPWEGVEFVEYEDIHFSGGQRYFKINWIDSEEGLIHVDSGYLSTSKCKPSNEQAYVEQLKKEAFERFGEIKEGDRFKLNDSISEITDMGITSWIYRKKTDAFGKHGVVLYQQGKWAERVKERVKVEISECVANCGTFDPYTIEAKFKIKNVKDYDHGNLPKFLTQQLEKYLNNEIE